MPEPATSTRPKESHDGRGKVAEPLEPLVQLVTPGYVPKSPVAPPLTQPS